MNGPAAHPPLLLLRHGQTTWNIAKRVQGRKDSPLTPLGEHQARAMGETVASLLPPPRRVEIVASPLGRTRQTAAIVAAALGLQLTAVRFDERLMELSWGAYDGFTRDEIAERDPGFFPSRHADHWHHRPPGGESYAQVAERLRAWLAERPSDRPLVVVTHGAASRVLRGLYLGLPPAATIAQDEPQDAIYRLHGGTAERISTGFRDPP